MIFLDVIMKLLLHGITLGASFLGAFYVMLMFNSAAMQKNNGEAILQLLDQYHLRVACYAPCGNDAGYTFYGQSAPFQAIGMIVATAVIYLVLSLFEGLLPSREESYAKFIGLRALCVLFLTSISVGWIYSECTVKWAQSRALSQCVGRVLEVGPVGAAWSYSIETVNAAPPYSNQEQWVKLRDGKETIPLKPGDLISFEIDRVSSVFNQSPDLMHNVRKISSLPEGTHVKLVTYTSGLLKYATIYDDGTLSGYNNLRKVLDPETFGKVKLLCDFAKASPKAIPRDSSISQPTVMVFPNYSYVYETKSPNPSPAQELITIIENEISELEKQCDYRVNTNLIYHLNDWCNQPPIDELMPDNFEFDKNYPINEKFRNDNVPWFTPRGYVHYRGKNAVYMLHIVSDKWKDAEISAYRYELIPSGVNFKYPATYYGKNISIVKRDEFEAHKEFYSRFLGKSSKVMLVKGNDAISKLQLSPYLQ